MSGQGPISYWLSTADLTPRAALSGSTDADVVVIGAGFTGLWTAYYLAAADPGLRIVVLEAQVAGYGASGRSGGWCSALFPASPAAVARKHGVARASALVAAMRDTIDEIGRVATAEGVDCDYAKGGTVVLARSAVQEARGRAVVDAEASAPGWRGWRRRRRLLCATQRECAAGPTHRTVRRYTPGSWCAAWPTRWNGLA